MISPLTSEHRKLFSFDTFRKLLINHTVLKAEHEKAQENINAQTSEIKSICEAQEIETDDRFEQL